jgi:hypothetical protein
MIGKEFEPRSIRVMRKDADRVLRQLDDAAKSSPNLLSTDLSRAHLGLFFGPHVEIDAELKLDIDAARKQIAAMRRDTFAMNRALRLLSLGLVGGQMSPEQLSRAKARSHHASDFIDFTQANPELATAVLNAGARAEALANASERDVSEANGRPAIKAFSGHPANTDEFPSRFSRENFHPTRSDGLNLADHAEDLFKVMRRQSFKAFGYAKEIGFGPDAITDFGLAATETASSFFSTREDQRLVAHEAQKMAVAALEGVSRQFRKRRVGRATFVRELTSYLAQVARGLDSSSPAPAKAIEALRVRALPKAEQRKWRVAALPSEMTDAWYQWGLALNQRLDGLPAGSRR